MDYACTSVQPLSLSHRFSHDNLHIRVDSHFDLPQAGILINLLRHYHQCCKRIFIDVRQLMEPRPMAVAALKASFLHSHISPEQVIFKGKTGFSMAVSGNKVLIVPEKERAPGKKHVCRGNCAECTCRHKKTSQAMFLN